MQDISLTRDQHSDQGCSSSQLVQHSGGKRKVEDMVFSVITYVFFVVHIAGILLASFL